MQAISAVQTQGMDILSQPATASDSKGGGDAGSFKSILESEIAGTQSGSTSHAGPKAGKAADSASPKAEKAAPDPKTGKTANASDLKADEILKGFDVQDTGKDSSTQTTRNPKEEAGQTVKKDAVQASAAPAEPAKEKLDTSVQASLAPPPVLTAKTPDAAPAKAGPKEDSGKAKSPDPSSVAIAGLPFNAPIVSDNKAVLPKEAKSNPVSPDSGKPAVQNTAEKGLPTGSPNSAPAQKDSSRAADFSPTGNFLPPKPSIAQDTHAATEKTVLPESSAGNPTGPIAANVPVQADAKPAPKMNIEAPVASPQWGNEVGQKIVWMTNADQHVAELHLNPPNLGPMEVKLTVQNDQATVQFVSHYPEVRAAIESALPKLREMMMDNGIALGNATVDSGAFQQSAFGQQERPRQGFSRETVPHPAIASIRTSRMIGKVDTFA